jgi:hypothetical protein
MSPLSFIKENPITVLGVAVLALLTWVAVDFSKVPAPKKPTAEPQALANELPLPGPPTEVAVADPGKEVPLTFPPGKNAVSTLVLPLVKPGMKRVEVESFLGPPTPDRIQPVTLSNGRMTYCTAYELDDLGPPMTIRPIHPRPRAPVQPPRSPRSLIAFVFDAGEPGHPLVDILFPDPLF